MENRVKAGILLMSMIVLIGFVNASTILTASPSSLNINAGSSQTIIISYNINTAGLAGQYGVSPTGFLSYSGNPIPYEANTTTMGTFSILAIIPSNASGDYSPTVSMGSYTLTIPIHVNEISSPGKCRIYVLPGSFSKTLEVGSQGSQIRDIYVSQYCDTSLIITTNSPQQTKPIYFEQIDGSVEPGQKFTIKVDYDARNVVKGVYSDSISISGIDGEENIYTLTLPISLTITGQISPYTNYSIFQSPECSFSNSELSVDREYKFI